MHIIYKKLNLMTVLLMILTSCSLKTPNHNCNRKEECFKEETCVFDSNGKNGICVPIKDFDQQMTIQDMSDEQGDQTITDQTITDQTITDQTITDQTITDQTITDQTITDQTITDQTITDQTITDQTITDQTITDQTITDQSMMQK